MGKFQFSGASKMKGVMGYPAFASGDYTLVVQKIVETDKTKEKNYIEIKHDFLIADAANAADCGKTWKWNQYILSPNHPSYNKDFVQRNVESEVALFNALGLSVNEDDTFPYDDAEGMEVGCSLQNYIGKRKDGTPQEQNRPIRFYPVQSIEDEAEED